MCVMLVRKLCMNVEGRCFLQDDHVAAMEAAREESTLLLRNFYKSEEIFVDMFEDEYRLLSYHKFNAFMFMKFSFIYV